MPKEFKISGFNIAIIAAIVTALVFLFLYLFLGINHRRDVYEDSKHIAKEISRKAAIETEIYLNSALETARSMQKRALTVKQLHGNRDDIKEILLDGLSSNPNFLATWTLWEPDAFDNKDDLFMNSSIYNQQGTLGLAYFRYNDSVFTEIMTEGDYNSLYYAPVKESNSEKVTNPYKFVYSGYKYQFFGTTVSVPIIENDRFLGVVGVDIDLKNLQKKLNQVKLYKTGFLSLISNNGIVVTHFDSTIVTKNVYNLLNGSDSLIRSTIINGSELTSESKSEFKGEKVFRFFYPIKIGKGDTPWSMMVEIPVAEATIRSKELFFVAMGTLIVGLSLLLYLIINIIDRRKYETVILNAKNKAEESDRLKTAFINNISHEIRTPLNGILGFTEMLVENNVDPDQAKSYKDIIHNSSNQLLTIITNVIELSKIQSCTIERKCNEFLVKNAIEKVIAFHLPELKSKGLSIVRKFAENENITINSDQEKFKQVLSYLLSNAIKFTDIGNIEIGYSLKNDTIQVYVKDTGIGIKPEYRKNIFKYFNQEDSTLTRNYGGLGVGLSISKSYVEILGGSIWFETEVGKGTIFFFTLPDYN